MWMPRRTKIAALRATELTISLGQMLVKPSTETHASVKPATMFLPILSAPQTIKERNALPSLMLVLMWQDSSCISDEQVSVCFFGANLIFEK